MKRVQFMAVAVALIGAGMGMAFGNVVAGVLVGTGIGMTIGGMSAYLDGQFEKPKPPDDYYSSSYRRGHGQ